MAPKAVVKVPAEGTKERFDQDLRNLAAKAKESSWDRRLRKQVIAITKSLAVIGLLAIFANASQRALSPTYGSIPASIWHNWLLAVGCFIGWAGNLFFRRYFDTLTLIPVVVLCTPMLQFLIETQSDVLGSTIGSAVTETVTLLPVAVFSAASLADLFDDITIPSSLKGSIPAFIADATPGIGSWSLFAVLRMLSGSWLQSNADTGLIYTRVGTELFLGGVYSILAPSKYLLLAVPALLHTATLNTHVATSLATASLNQTLLSQNWMLLDRQESVTGYVSVLQNMEAGYRVMRCDHSLLGGEWVEDRGDRIAEPVYGVFAMLEAVRLIETERRMADKDAKALVIGMGVGTTPSALVSHGIDTTVVEIDPAVAKFAQQYFGLRENNAPVVQDATVYAADAAKSDIRYDFIVHDVFTGGAEPVDLFTLEFLTQLYNLLQPNGAIAINYAGDLSLSGPKTVVNTIKNVFPSCRIFREYPTNVDIVSKSGTDFTNMVVFCKKTGGPLTFRKPVEADFLKSYARQEFLQPEHEVDIPSYLGKGETVGLLMKNDTAEVTKSHKTSAVGHWKIMRTVLPASVWQRW